MHGLPRDFDASIFSSREILQVCFSANLVAIKFDGELTLVIMGEFSITRGDRVTHGAADELLRPEIASSWSSVFILLIGQKAEVANPTSNGTLGIQFETGDTLTLFDTPMYESYVISYKGQQLIV